MALSRKKSLLVVWSFLLQWLVALKLSFVQRLHFLCVSVLFLNVPNTQVS